MDNPHLVAMQNRLQDLLDAVTAANSRRISAGGPRRVGGGAGAGCCVALGWGPQPGRGPREAGNQGAARPPAPPTLPSPLARPLEVLLRGDMPGPRALFPRLMLAKPGPELGALQEGGPA